MSSSWPFYACHSNPSSPACPAAAFVSKALAACSQREKQTNCFCRSWKHFLPDSFKAALRFVSPVRFQPLFSALRTLSSIFLKKRWREKKKSKVLQLWETCCFGAWKLPRPVNRGRPLSQPWKRRGGVQCKLMETFMKANKDKAWQESLFHFLQCEARPVAGSTNLILFLWLTTQKNIQGIYSYAHSANYKSVNTLFKNK